MKFILGDSWVGGGGGGRFFGGAGRVVGRLALAKKFPDFRSPRPGCLRWQLMLTQY